MACMYSFFLLILFLYMLAEYADLFLVCLCFLPSLISPSLFPAIGSKMLDVLHSGDLATLIISPSSSSLVRLVSIRPAFTMLLLRLGTLNVELCDLTPPYRAQYLSVVIPVTSGSSLILHLSIPYLDCSSHNSCHSSDMYRRFTICYLHFKKSLSI